jgi:large conductance mechanosensitive channel
VTGKSILRHTPAVAIDKIRSFFAMLNSQTHRRALEGFLLFIREQGVVGLAVGFILGAAVAKVVAAIVTDIVDPILGFLLGSAKGLTEVVAGPFKIGHLLSTMIDFLAIAAVVYFLVKGLGLDKLDSKKEGGNEGAKDELKDELKKRNEAAGGKKEE